MRHCSSALQASAPVCATLGRFGLEGCITFDDEWNHEYYIFCDGQAVVIFYRYVPRSIPAWQEDYWFAAACFSCLWDGDTRFIPLEQALAQLKLTSDSMEHRLAGLLDQRWEADGFFLGKLSRIIKLAKAKGIAIDCALLLEDLLYWNSSTQSVQRKWAKAMYE